MVKNYFKVALRSLLRNKSFTVINVVGLTGGIASCLLIFLIISYETSFDTFHRQRDNIYRVVSVMNMPDGTRYSPGVPFPVAKAMRTDFPQIKKAANIISEEDALISLLNYKNETEKKYKEESGTFFTEPDFFEIFDFKWITGKPSALAEPNTAVLTREIAEKYFGNWQAAVGRTIKYKNKTDFKITGILENIPANSDFPLKVVLSYKSFEYAELDDWISVHGNHYCFILLPEGSRAAQLSTLLPAFTEKYKPKEYLNDQLNLQHLSEMHFDTRFDTYGSTFSKELITALSLIGIFLLIIACVNFINLATAQAVNRSREVGIRKVLGGNRSQLVIQFIGETAIITILAVIFAVVVSELFLPYLNSFLTTSIKMQIFNNWELQLFLLIVSLAVIFLSGFYPAVMLSGFNPVTAFKNKSTTKGGGVSLRRGLVVLQFIIAQVLIIGMLIVVNQMNLFNNSSLGYNKEAVVLVPIPNDSLSLGKLDVLKNQLRQLPGILNTSFSFFTPSDNSHWTSDFQFDKSIKKTDFNASLKWADPDYFKLYELTLIAGKYYAASDTIREFVINEALVKKLGIKNPEEALGRELNFWDGEHTGPIVGVVKDFHEGSLRGPIHPVVLSTWKEVYQIINIKINPLRMKETLAHIEQIWISAYPEYVYEYQFLDQKINSFYEHEEQLSQLYKVFAGIAIFISCLGLYGLISFMAAQRTREVGIRKVLGASAFNIVYLFFKEFSLLILFAFIAAAPISFFIMNKWLQDFSFRIEPGAGIFIIALISSMVIAWITIGYRAMKTASADPVKSLRYE